MQCEFVANVILDQCDVPYGLPQDCGKVYFGIIQNHLLGTRDPAQQASALEDVLTDLSGLPEPISVVLPASEFAHPVSLPDLVRLANRESGCHSNVELVFLMDVPGMDWINAVPGEPEDAIPTVMCTLSNGGSCVVLSAADMRCGFVHALLAIHNHLNCHKAKIIDPICEAKKMSLTPFQLPRFSWVSLLGCLLLGDLVSRRCRLTSMS